MMLDPQSWLAAAQALPTGGRKRVDHDCGAGRTLLVSQSETGWTAWCFRCGLPGFVPYPQPSLAERVARLKKEAAADDAAERDPRPPMPAEFDPTQWPSEARVWLYKAGLSNDRIKELGFYWAPSLRRVVLPVFSNGVLAYWQARGFDKARPKYLNPNVDKPLFKTGSGRVLVLTEDILSAAKVGLVTEAWSLLGTSAGDDILAQVVATGKPVRVWLDPDAAGRKGTTKLLATLRAHGIDAAAIRSAKDPKLHSQEEITELVST